MNKNKNKKDHVNVQLLPETQTLLMCQIPVNRQASNHKGEITQSKLN